MAVFLTTSTDPLLTDVERTMDQMLDRAFGRWALAPNPQQAASSPSTPATTPGAISDVFRTLANVGHHAFDIIEKKDCYELIADAPGFQTSDINIELDNNILTISGTITKAKRTQEDREKAEGKVWRSERRMASFKRAFTLPENAQHEGIGAKLDKGVLTVHVPKQPEAPKPEPKRITVQGSA